MILIYFLQPILSRAPFPGRCFGNKTVPIYKIVPRICRVHGTMADFVLRVMTVVDVVDKTHFCWNTQFIQQLLSQHNVSQRLC